MYGDKDYELEYLRLENEKLRRELTNSTQDNFVDMDSIQQVMNLAVKMRQLLEECRGQQINISLAKRIDGVLNEAKQFD
jgi:hypothetical protein